MCFWEWNCLVEGYAYLQVLAIAPQWLYTNFYFSLEDYLFFCILSST